MLIPKKTKYKKMQRGRLTGKACRNIKIIYGKYALQALEPAWITSKQIEAVRKIITRSIKKLGKLWIKIFPDKSVTVRSTESRMGSGKGSVSYWVAVIKPGHILFEISDIPQQLAIESLRTASYKLPIKTKILIK
jgi:large subunit ribosomal protein L16